MTSGLAGVKLSGSPNRLGENVDSAVKRASMMIKPRISLKEW